MEIRSIAVDLARVRGRSSAATGTWSPDGASPFGPGIVRAGPIEVRVDSVALGSGVRHDLVLRCPEGPGCREVALDRVRLQLRSRPSRVLEHGWQSWSSVSRRDVDRVAPTRRIAPTWVRSIYHAAPELAGRAVVGDQFLLASDGCGPRGTEGGIAGFLDGRRHLSSVVASRRGVVALALLDGISLAPGEEWALDPLWLAEGDPGPLYSEYLDHWAVVADARASGPSPLGWGSWYHYFWKVAPADVRANLAVAGRHGFELFQLDDGYQRAVGDWLDPNPRFAPRHVPELAAEISGAGMQPGIWTAPFLASPKSKLARDHPEWLAGRKPMSGASGTHSTRSCRAMWNPRAWKGWALTLDTTHPGLLDHLRHTFAALVADGWTYHKIDFCYAAAVRATRAGDGRVTRAQALRAGLDAVRDGIGDASVLVGCGMPLGQAVGVVDIMRVSADTAPSWRPGPVRLPGYPDLAPSAIAALQASVLRAPMHRRLWVNDPDCLLLREDHTRLSDDQRRILVAANIGTGAFTMVSDDLTTYGAAQWELLDRLRALHPVADVPLDMADPFATAPAITGGTGTRLEVDWAGGPPRPPDAGARGARPAPPPDEGRPASFLGGGRPGTGPWARWWGPAGPPDA